MTNIFSELKNMDHQFASALSTMLKLRLVVFLHFDKHAVENAQSNVMYDSNMPIWLPDTNFRFYHKQQGCQASYWDVRDDFGTPKGHALSL